MPTASLRRDGPRYIPRRPRNTWFNLPEPSDFRIHVSVPRDHTFHVHEKVVFPPGFRESYGLGEEDKDLYLNEVTCEVLKEDLKELYEDYVRVLADPTAEGRHFHPLWD